MMARSVALRTMGRMPSNWDWPKSRDVALKATESDIRDWCRNYLTMTLEIPAVQISPETRFSRLGMDSASMLTFLVGLEEWLDVEIDPEIAFEHPTLAELAKYVATLT